MRINCEVVRGGNLHRNETRKNGNQTESNPYVIIKLYERSKTNRHNAKLIYTKNGKSYMRTKTIYKDSNPVWQQSFEFEIPELNRNNFLQMEFTVMDIQKAGVARKLGVAVVELNDILVNKGVSHEYWVDVWRGGAPQQARGLPTPEEGGLLCVRCAQVLPPPPVPRRDSHPQEETEKKSRAHSHNPDSMPSETGKTIGYLHFTPVPPPSSIRRSQSSPQPDHAAVFNSIKDPHNRCFSSALRSYSPSLSMSDKDRRNVRRKRHLSPSKSIQSASFSPIGSPTDTSAAGAYGFATPALRPPSPPVCDVPQGQQMQDKLVRSEGGLAAASPPGSPEKEQPTQNSLEGFKGKSTLRVQGQKLEKSAGCEGGLAAIASQGSPEKEQPTQKPLEGPKGKDALQLQERKALRRQSLLQRAAMMEVVQHENSVKKNPSKLKWDLLTQAFLVLDSDKAGKIIPSKVEEFGLFMGVECNPQLMQTFSTTDFHGQSFFTQDRFVAMFSRCLSKLHFVPFLRMLEGFIEYIVLAPSQKSILVQLYRAICQSNAASPGKEERVNEALLYLFCSLVSPKYTEQDAADLAKGLNRLTNKVLQVCHFEREMALLCSCLTDVEFHSVVKRFLALTQKASSFRFRSSSQRSPKNRKDGFLNQKLNRGSSAKKYLEGVEQAVNPSPKNGSKRSSHKRQKKSSQNGEDSVVTRIGKKLSKLDVAPKELETSRSTHATQPAGTKAVIAAKAPVASQMLCFKTPGRKKKSTGDDGKANSSRNCSEQKQEDDASSAEKSMKALELHIEKINLRLQNNQTGSLMLLQQSYEVMKKHGTGDVALSQVVEFGMYMMQEWDEVELAKALGIKQGSCVNEDLFMRLGASRLVSQQGKGTMQVLCSGFLEANKIPGCRRAVLLDIVDAMLCNSSAVMRHEVEFFGCCLDTQFSQDEAEWVLERMFKTTDKSWQVHQFLGCFAHLCNRLDDVDFFFAVERFVDFADAVTGTPLQFDPNQAEKEVARSVTRKIALEAVRDQTQLMLRNALETSSPSRGYNSPGRVAVEPSACKAYEEVADGSSSLDLQEREILLKNVGFNQEQSANISVCPAALKTDSDVSKSHPKGVEMTEELLKPETRIPVDDQLPSSSMLDPPLILDGKVQGHPPPILEGKVQGHPSGFNTLELEMNMPTKGNSQLLQKMKVTELILQEPPCDISTVKDAKVVSNHEDDVSMWHESSTTCRNQGNDAPTLEDSSKSQHVMNSSFVHGSSKAWSSHGKPPKSPRTQRSDSITLVTYDDGFSGTTERHVKNGITNKQSLLRLKKAKSKVEDQLQVVENAISNVPLATEEGNENDQKSVSEDMDQSDKAVEEAISNGPLATEEGNDIEQKSVSEDMDQNDKEIEGVISEVLFAKRDDQDVNMDRSSSSEETKGLKRALYWRPLETSLPFQVEDSFMTGLKCVIEDSDDEDGDTNASSKKAAIVKVLQTEQPIIETAAGFEQVAVRRQASKVNLKEGTMLSSRSNDLKFTVQFEEERSFRNLLGEDLKISYAGQKNVADRFGKLLRRIRMSSTEADDDIFLNGVMSYQGKKAKDEPWACKEPSTSTSQHGRNSFHGLSSFDSSHQSSASLDSALSEVLSLLQEVKEDLRISAQKESFQEVKETASEGEAENRLVLDKLRQVEGMALSIKQFVAEGANAGRQIPNCDSYDTSSPCSTQRQISAHTCTLSQETNSPHYDGGRKTSFDQQEVSNRGTDEQMALLGDLYKQNEDMEANVESLMEELQLETKEKEVLLNLAFQKDKQIDNLLDYKRAAAAHIRSQANELEKMKGIQNKSSLW